MVFIPSAAKSWHKQHSGFIFLALFAFACSAALMYWITAQGPGVSPDSVTYIDAARNLLAGNGFVIDGEPITHYPPLYPLLIAAVDWLHPGDTIQAARLVAVFFYSANLVLVGLAVYLCTEYSIAAAGCAMLVFLSSAHMLSVHAMAWSEAPFIAFCMSSIICCSLHIANPRLWLLVLAGGMAGLAAVTRYIGVVLFPTIVLTFLLIDKRTLNFKIKDALLFTSIAFSLLSLFIVRNVAVGDSATNRELEIHLIDFAYIKIFFVSASDFILPVEIPSLVKLILLFSISFFLFYSAIKIFHHKKRDVTIVSVFLVNSILYLVNYIIFLFVSISFFDHHILLDKRILSPILTVGFASTVVIGWFMRNRSAQRYSWKIFIYSVFFYIGISTIAAIPTALRLHKDGHGYTSRYWNNLEMIKDIPLFSQGKRIYSNGNDIIKFLIEKKSIPIPEKISPGTMMPSGDYTNSMRKMIEECKERKAIIVYFNAIGWRWYLPSVEEIDSSGDLPVLIKNEDGVIYGTAN